LIPAISILLFFHLAFVQHGPVSKAFKIWIAVAVVLVAGLVAVAWFGRPAYRHYKEKRALKRATEFVEQKDYRSAVLSLRIALSINPANLTAAQMMANLLDAGRSPAALGWRKRVAELEPSLNNKIMVAACALAYEQKPFTLASQQLESIRDAGETNEAYHLVASQLALKLNRLNEAEAHLESAIRLNPTNRQHQLNASTLRLYSTNREVVLAARRELTEMVGDPTLGIVALRSLTSTCLTLRDLAEASEYSLRLQQHPGATLEDRLMRLTVLSEAGSPELMAALGKVQQAAGSSAPTAAQVISWMNGNKRSKEALEWAAALPKSVRETIPVPMAQAECYMALADWEGLQDLLVGNKWDEQEFLRLALLARALREQGDTDNTARTWRRALEAAASKPELTLTLLQLARTWGWADESRDLLWATYKRRPSEEWAIRVLLQDYGRENDTAGLYRAFKALLEKHAQSVELKNNVAALGLLLGEDIPRSTQLAREVYDSEKTNAVLASTYAFALHTQGKTAEALTLLEAFPESELQRPEIALYYSVLLSADGQRDKAKPYFAAAEKHQPLLEERALLEKARVSSP
jgi:tetratricopeptide (TPR) repeat protein